MLRPPAAPILPIGESAVARQPPPQPTALLDSNFGDRYFHGLPAEVQAAFFTALDFPDDHVATVGEVTDIPIRRVETDVNNAVVVGSDLNHRPLSGFFLGKLMGGRSPRPP